MRAAWINGYRIITLVAVDVAIWREEKSVRFNVETLRLHKLKHLDQLKKTHRSNKADIKHGRGSNELCNPQNA